MVTLRRWADVGLWVAVCVLAKISLRRPKTTFARLTQSQAISQSKAFSSLSMRDTNKFHFFFHFFETLFYHFLYHGDQMFSWWIICRWRAVKFEMHLCSSGMNSDLRECCFWGLCKPVIASTDLWPQEMFTFWKCMQMVAHLHGLVRKQFQCHPGGRLRLSWGACGASCTRASCRSDRPTNCSDVIFWNNLTGLDGRLQRWIFWTPRVKFLICPPYYWAIPRDEGAAKVVHTGRVRVMARILPNYRSRHTYRHST